MGAMGRRGYEVERDELDSSGLLKVNIMGSMTSLTLLRGPGEDEPS
jgi:hypothetical protein